MSSSATVSESSPSSSGDAMGQPPGWNDDFNKPGYRWQTRDFYDMFQTAMWLRAYAAAFSIESYDAYEYPDRKPHIIAHDSSPSSTSFWGADLDIQGIWSSYQSQIDPCIPKDQLTSAGYPLGIEYYQFDPNFYLGWFYGSFIPSNYDLLYACEVCNGNGSSGDHEPYIPVGPSALMGYSQPQFRTAAKINVDKGWRRIRPREIASVTDTKDVQGNPATDGMLALLLGWQDYPAHPENIGIPCYVYQYVETAPEGDPYPSAYPKWVTVGEYTGAPSSSNSSATGSSHQDDSSTSNDDGGRSCNGKPCPDLLDSDDPSTGIMPGGVAKSGDYLGPWIFSQIRDALNQLNLVCNYGGATGPSFLTVYYCPPCPDGVPCPIYRYGSAQEAWGAATVRADRPPDPANPPYVQLWPFSPYAPYYSPMDANMWGAGVLMGYGRLAEQNDSSDCLWSGCACYSGGYTPTLGYGHVDVNGTDTSDSADELLIPRSARMFLYSAPWVPDSWYDYNIDCQPQYFADNVFGGTLPMLQWTDYESFGPSTKAALLSAQGPIPKSPVKPNIVGDCDHIGGLGAIVGGVMGVFNFWHGYQWGGKDYRGDAPDDTPGAHVCDETLFTVSSVDSSSSSPSSGPHTTTGACSECAECCFTMGIGPGEWTPPCDGWLRVYYNDALAPTNNYPSAVGQFLLSTNLGGIGVITVYGHDPVGTSLNVKAGQVVKWTATGTINNGQASDYDFIGGPNGVGIDEQCTQCQCTTGAAYGLIGQFEPIGLDTVSSSSSSSSSKSSQSDGHGGHAHPPGGGSESGESSWSSQSDHSSASDKSSASEASKSSQSRQQDDQSSNSSSSSEVVNECCPLYGIFLDGTPFDGTYELAIGDMFDGQPTWNYSDATVVARIFYDSAFHNWHTTFTSTGSNPITAEFVAMTAHCAPEGSDWAYVGIEGASTTSEGTTPTYELYCVTPSSSSQSSASSRSDTSRSSSSGTDVINVCDGICATVPDSAFSRPATTGFIYTPSPAPAGITFAGGAGVTNGTGGHYGFAFPTPTPGGVPQAAFLQGDTTISITVTDLVPGHSYVASLWAVLRTTYDPTTLTLQVDGTQIGTSYTPSGTWEQWGAVFVPTASTATLTIVSTNTLGGDCSSIVTALCVCQGTVAPVPPTAGSSSSGSSHSSLSSNSSSSSGSSPTSQSSHSSQSSASSIDEQPQVICGGVVVNNTAPSYTHAGDCGDDPHWSINGVAAVRYYNGAYISAASTADSGPFGWISDRCDGGSAADTFPFQTTIYIPSGIDLTTFRIGAYAAADNSITAITVNGVAVTGTFPDGFSSFVYYQFPAGTNWQHGTNTVVVSVNNSGGPMAFAWGWTCDAPSSSSSSSSTSSASSLSEGSADSGERIPRPAYALDTPAKAAASLAKAMKRYGPGTPGATAIIPRQRAEVQAAFADVMSANPWILGIGMTGSSLFDQNPRDLDVVLIVTDMATWEKHRDTLDLPRWIDHRRLDTFAKTLPLAGDHAVIDLTTLALYAPREYNITGVEDGIRLVRPPAKDSKPCLPCQRKMAQAARRRRAA